MNYLDREGIHFEVYSTTGEMDAFSYVKDRLDIENCSAIAIVGGDGSTHEVVNGMLNR
jgi:diacylglycerol kinase family enzyme